MLRSTDGGIIFNCHVYYIDKLYKRKTANTASACLQRWNASLATVESQEERLFLKSMLHQLDPNQDVSYYLGKLLIRTWYLQHFLV